MNRFALGVLIITVCSSCAVYQKNTLSSDIRGTVKEPFTLENDTLRLQYYFNNGVCHIEIFNKSYVPLYVDWSRSALIIDGNSEAYWTNEISALTNSVPVSFIPPNSRFLNAPFDLINRSIPVEVESKTVRPKRYTPATSPLTFRSYLLLSYDQDFNESFALDYTFWISETSQSKGRIYSQTQNTYTTSRLTDGATFFGGIIALGAIVTWFVASASQ